MSKKKKLSRRTEMRDQIEQLDKIYNEYNGLSSHPYTPRMQYRVIGIKQYFAALVLSYFVMITVSVFVDGVMPHPIAFAEMPFVSFLVMFFISLIEDRRSTRQSQCGEIFVTFHFCTKKNFEQVQSTYDEVNTKVIQLRAAARIKHKMEVREAFVARIEKAKKVNPEFKALFGIIENELGGTVAREYSDNDYGLPDDVMIRASVSDMLSDMGIFIPKGLCLSPFELNEGQLDAWKTYVAMLRSFKKEYHSVDKLLAKARQVAEQG